MRREAYAEGANASWANWQEDASLERTLSTGETWRVSIAIDRTLLAGTGEFGSGTLAFAYTIGLTSVSIPYSVTNIDSYAFSD